MKRPPPKGSKMNSMKTALRKAGVEHRKTVEIRDTYTRTMATAKRKQASAAARGLCTTLAGRIAKAQAKAHAPKPQPEAPAYGPQHIANGEPWERLASAVVGAWR